jgi:hypothetical protein
MNVCHLEGGKDHIEGALYVTEAPKVEIIIGGDGRSVWLSINNKIVTSIHNISEGVEVSAPSGYCFRVVSARKKNVELGKASSD